MELNYTIQWNKPVRRYAFAVVAVATVTIARWALEPIVAGNSRFVLYTLAIMATARFAGQGPALAATALSLPVGWYFFNYHHYSLVPAHVDDAVNLALLAFIGVGIAVLSGQLANSLAEASATAERYSLMVDGVTEYALSMVDASGRIESWNPGAERLEGFQIGQVAGRNIAMFYTPEERAAGVPDGLLERAASKGVAHHAGWRVRKDGTRFWAETTLTALRYKRGGLRGYAQLTRDRTEDQSQRAALEEGEETIRSLIESAAQGIIGAGADGKIAIANAMAERLFGYPREELLGQPLEILLPEGLRERHRSHRAGFQADPRERPMGRGLELTARRKDGSEFAVEVSLNSIQTPRGLMSAAFINDVTESKRAEQAILRLNAELDQRVQERTAQLEAANKELETFSYSVSHDLRAPLRGIDGWSLALLEDYGCQLDDKARQYLGRVRSETQRMGKLIDDLLQLSGINRSEVVRKRVDLTALARTIAKRMAEAHPGRRLEFAIEPELTVQADVRLMEVALTNLIGNAVKFTEPRDIAHIEVGRMEQNGERPFFVRDNGAGFDMAHAGALFQAFQRLHKNSEFPGTGVGLATVQRVVSRHGGRIWVEARSGKGAAFYFTIGKT